MRSLFKAAREELLSTKSMFDIHKSKLIFYIWLLVNIYVFVKLRYVYLLFIWYVLFSALILLLKKNPKILIKKSRNSIFVNFLKIKILKGLFDSKFSKELIPIFLLFAIIRLVLGISYKTIRCSISLFDCLEKEYRWAEMGKKKKTKKILKKYIVRSLDQWAYTEFIKTNPCIGDELVLKRGGFNKTIKVERE